MSTKTVLSCDRCGATTTEAQASNDGWRKFTYTFPGIGNRDPQSVDCCCNCSQKVIDFMAPNSR